MINIYVNSHVTPKHTFAIEVETLDVWAWSYRKQLWMLAPLSVASIKRHCKLVAKNVKFHK